MMNWLKRLRGKFARLGERGNVLVYLAAGILPFTACMGIVIDYGMAAMCRSQMQKTVDSAALAGATALSWGVWTSPETPEQKAEDMVHANYTLQDSYNIDVGTDRVTVTMDRDVPTHFMRVFGKNEVYVKVHATALRGTPMEANTGHLMPFCLINPNTNRDPGDDLNPSNWGKRYILAYGEPNIAPQDWANGTNPPPYVPPGSGSGMGWRSGLRLNSDGTMGGSGASDFRDVFINGWDGTANIGELVPVLTGNIDGPIEQGRTGRLTGTEGDIFSNFDPDLGFIDNRIILVPIVSLVLPGTKTRMTIDQFDAGVAWDHSYVIIDGFAPFWLLTSTEQGDVNNDGKALRDNDWITGYFIPGTRVPMGSEGGGTGGDYYGLIAPPKLID